MRKNNQKNKKKASKGNQNTKVKDMDFEVSTDTTLLPFLLESMPKSSRNSVKSTLVRGQVAVDGTVVTQHNEPLHKGQQVSIKSNHNSMKEDGLYGVEIIFEDDDFIVIEKESGLLSVATKNGSEITAYGQLMNYVKKDHPKNRVYVVHRLDKDTSGVMIFAKSERMKHALQENWKDTVTERKYTALVEGAMKKSSDTIRTWLTESKAFKMHSSLRDNGGQEAITHYKTLRSNDRYSLLEVSLETGRKNQIRVHMEEIGHPIVGDKKYGSQANPLKRLGLHATTLGFTHPDTGEKIKFESKVPKKFLNMSYN